jgi:hypothetical protein
MRKPWRDSCTSCARRINVLRLTRVSYEGFDERESAREVLCPRCFAHTPPAIYRPSGESLLRYGRAY